MKPGIGRYRGFGGAHIQRYRAGQRINIPRSFGRQRMPMVRRNTTVFLGGYQGGHHCCCGGGGSKFLNWMTGITTFMGVFGSFFGGLFGRREAQVDPYEAQEQYADGRRTGYYTPGDYSLGNRAGQNTPANTDNAEITTLKQEIADLSKTVKSLQETLDNAKKGDGLGGPKTDVDEKENDKDAPTDYKNNINNTDGFSYNKNGTVTIKNKNVPEIVTLSAFILNDNDKSTISLTARDWKNDFELVFGKNKTVFETEFTSWFENYAKEAEARTQEKNTTQRRLVETVNITDSDKAFIKRLYSAMSNNGTTLSANQFETFMKGFFNDKSYYSNDGSFSRKEFVDYVDKKIKEQKSS